MVTEYIKIMAGGRREVDTARFSRQECSSSVKPQPRPRPQLQASPSPAIHPCNGRLQSWPSKSPTLTVTLKNTLSARLAAARRASSSRFLPSSTAALSPRCTAAGTAAGPWRGTRGTQGTVEGRLERCPGLKQRPCIERSCGTLPGLPSCPPFLAKQQFVELAPHTLLRCPLLPSCTHLRCRLFQPLQLLCLLNQPLLQQTSRHQAGK